MRGLFVAILILSWVPVLIFKPYIGILVWSWVSHMNPHSYTYNFANTFPFLDIIAALTVVGVFISKDRKVFTVHPIVIILFMYLLWVLLTTVLGYNPAASQIKLIHMSKVLLFAFMSMIVMQSPNRLKAFLWVMGLSMAFIAIKGGLFTVLTGGTGRVQGAGGMMSDNNQLAMALSMMVPIMFYFYKYPPVPLLRWPLLGAAALTVIGVLGTQSRGGFAALAGVVAMMLLKSKKKVAMLGLLIPIALFALAFMPDTWTNRMETVGSATEDSSFMGRVSMWKFSVNLADEHPVEGGGFDVFYRPRARELFMPPGFKARAPHSIYFEVLGEHGYVGLFLFLSILFTGWYSAGAAAREYREYRETLWLGDLAAAIQLSLVGYAVGGLTVNVATFDLFYHLLAIVVMMSIVGQRLIQENPDQVEANAVSGGRAGKEEKARKNKGKWVPDSYR